MTVSSQKIYVGSQTGVVTATFTSHLETIASLKEEHEDDEGSFQHKKNTDII